MVTDKQRAAARELDARGWTAGRIATKLGVPVQAVVGALKPRQRTSLGPGSRNYFLVPEDNFILERQGEGLSAAAIAVLVQVKFGHIRKRQVIGRRLRQLAKMKERNDRDR